ncbi:hypothetical protein SRHO_G00240620 [Serrasalmus rhombeus]
MLKNRLQDMKTPHKHSECDLHPLTPTASHARGVYDECERVRESTRGCCACAPRKPRHGRRTAAAAECFFFLFTVRSRDTEERVSEEKKEELASGDRGDIVKGEERKDTHTSRFPD